MSEFLFRPIEKKDLGGLYKLVHAMKSGLASLPNHREQLRARIEQSEESFRKRVIKPGLQSYLFVLEDLEEKTIIGVSGIHARSTVSPYFYVYEIKKEEGHSEELKIHNTAEFLQLKKITDSPAELCSLYLKEDYRHYGLSSLLSFSRYLFIANNRKRFPDKVLANLKGYRDDHELSPFWRAVGKPFLKKDLQTVDAMKSLGHSSFIEKLMPHHPIYVHLLPAEARACIGKVHHKTEAAYHLLIKQGFQKIDWVDIFDGAPYLIANLSEVESFKNICCAKIGNILNRVPISSRNYIVAPKNSKFRAIACSLMIYEDNTIGLGEKSAKLLGVGVGDEVCYLAL